MEWMKVKSRYIFHEGFNKTTLWAYIRLMALTAELETMPTEKQMLSVVTKHELKLLSNHFETQAKLVSNILQKVLEDVSKVKAKRKKDNERNAQVGEKQKEIAREPEVNREVDKIREDKTHTCSGEAEAIISYLNEKTGRDFHLTDSNLKFVSGRLGEGYSAEDLRKVVDAKVKDKWFIENKKFLRPETLFNATKFQTYIQEVNEVSIKESQTHPWEEEERKKKEAMEKYYAEHPEERQ